MLKFLNSNQKNFQKKLEFILDSRKIKQRDQSNKIKKILLNVKNKGDKAVISYEKKFSKIRLKSKKIKFSKNEISKISRAVDKKLKNSIDLAFKRIKFFHSKQKFSSFKYKDRFRNEVSYKYSAIDKIGVYVPGGTASYPSTVLMNCIPAMVAGVKNIYLTTPSLGAKVNPAIIYAAKKCGVRKFIKQVEPILLQLSPMAPKLFKKLIKLLALEISLWLQLKRRFSEM